MKPATLQERLERIQSEIAKIGTDFIPKTQTTDALYNELLTRESILKAKIEKEIADERYIRYRFCRRVKKGVDI